jgi:hypothetical protein
MIPLQDSKGVLFGTQIFQRCSSHHIMGLDASSAAKAIINVRMVSWAIMVSTDTAALM